MAHGILVVNAGSSSIKLALYTLTRRGLSLSHRAQADGLGGGSRARLLIRDARGGTVLEEQLPGSEHAPAMERVLGWLETDSGHPPLVAVGHRVVHGGAERNGPVLLNPRVLEDLARLEPLAPLHQVHNLAPATHLAERLPRVPQVACFDTAFHRSQPAVAQLFALPRRYTEDGVLRYGFHGLSYQYIAGWLAAHRPRLHRGHVVVAHLGNGASVCGLRAGRSVATSMGFTALDGLPMGTRCGSLDPGVVLHLMDHYGLDVRTVEDLLYRKSGLLGMSGLSHDMRELLDSGSAEAAEAVAVYCYRAAREIASAAAGIGGLDALVFTAGIGENAPAVREGICEHLRWLGIRLDGRANDRNAPVISAGDSQPVLVVPTDEEGEIARQTMDLTTPGADGRRH